MYRRPSGQLKIEEFVLPFEGKLNPENRWVKLSKLIPWEEIEMKYAQNFPSGTGTEAKPLRMALGALILLLKKNVGIRIVKRSSRSRKTRICSSLSD